MVRVLITGVGGFAGRRLAELAIAYGAQTFGQSRTGLTLPGVTTLQAHLGDDQAARRLVAAAAPDYVFHLAAQTPANTPGASPQSWLTTNPLATLNLLEAIRLDQPQARVLVVSSSAIYGHIHESDLPITETMALQPTTLYGVSKAAQELVAIRYAAEAGLHVVRARPFNQVGPGEPAGMLTSTLAMQVARIAAGAAPPIIRLRHRATQRDYTDVRDTVRAYWDAIERGHTGDVYNVCSGIATPIGDIVELLLRIARTEAQVVETDPHPSPGDILVQRGSNHHIRATVGWEPRLTLEQSLTDVLRSFQS